MVLGHAAGIGRGFQWHAAPGSPPPPAEPYMFNRPTDVAWDAAGQYFRLRRLRQFARREVRQERPLHHVGGNARAREPGPVQSSPHDRGRRQGQRLRRRPQQQPHSSVRQRSDVQGDLRQGRRALGRLHHARARISICSAPIRIPTATIPKLATVPAKSTRWSWTAPFSASSGNAGKQLGEFSTVHEIDCRNGNELWYPKSRLASAESCAAAAKDRNRRISMRTSAYIFLAVALAAALPLLRSVPEIAYDSAPNLLKTARNIYLGEAAGVATNSKGNIFVYTRTGDAYATTGTSRTFTHGGARLFEFDPDRQLRARDRPAASTGFCSRKRCASIRRTTSGLSIGCRTWSSSSTRKDACVMTMGRKPEALYCRRPRRRSRPRGAPERGDAARRAGARSCRDRALQAISSTAHRCGLGCGREIFSSPTATATRASRSSTRTGSSSNPGARGERAGPVQHAALDRHRCARQRLRRRPRQQAHSGFRQRREFQDPDFRTSELRRPSAFRRDAHQYLYASNSNAPNSLDNGEIYKMELDGKILGKFGTAGKLMKEFGIGA